MNILLCEVKYELVGWCYLDSQHSQADLGFIFKNLFNIQRLRFCLVALSHILCPTILQLVFTLKLQTVDLETRVRFLISAISKAKVYRMASVTFSPILNFCGYTMLERNDGTYYRWKTGDCGRATCKYSRSYVPPPPPPPPPLQPQPQK